MVSSNRFWVACAAGFALFFVMTMGMGDMMGISLPTLAVIALVGYFGWRWWNDQDFDDEPAQPLGSRGGLGGGRAIRVLRERFANGEIDEDEYQARKRVLLD